VKPGVAFEILRDGADDVLLLDLRPAQEYSGPLGHVRWARNVPLDDLPAKLPELRDFRKHTIIAYCRRDDCGERGVNLLREAGFEGALLLEGGIDAWVDDGFGAVGMLAPQAAVEGPPPDLSDSLPPDAKMPRPGSIYMRLADGVLILPPRVPEGLHVVGRLEGGQFVPERGAGVMGAGESCLEYRARAGDEGVVGWFELRDGRFVSAETGADPRPPFLAGCLGSDGLFRPAGRTIGD
jgi:rhodanese-related sulfurtransferase